MYSISLGQPSSSDLFPARLVSGRKRQLAGSRFRVAGCSAIGSVPKRSFSLAFGAGKPETATHRLNLRLRRENQRQAVIGIVSRLADSMRDVGNVEPPHGIGHLGTVAAEARFE
jgi:hypothetical protein